MESSNLASAPEASQELAAYTGLYTPAAPDFRRQVLVGVGVALMAPPDDLGIATEEGITTILHVATHP